MAESETTTNSGDEAAERFANGLASLRASQNEQEKPAYSAAVDAVAPLPEPEAVEAPQEAPEATESADAPVQSDDTTDAIEAALEGRPRKTREEAIADRDSLRQKAVDAGIPDEVAKALAANVKAEKAQEFLDTYQQMVQSEDAGQPDAAEAAAPEAAAPGEVSAEVQQLLQSELSEETATAVAKLIGGLEAKVAQLEGAAGVAQQVAADMSAKQMISNAAQALKGQFPQLLQGDKVDPEVGQRVAALLQGGVYDRSQLTEAFREAATMVYGGKAESSSSQTSSSPDLEAPASPSLEPDTLIDDRTKFERLRQIQLQNAKNPKLGDMLATASKRIDQHNKAVQRKRRKG
jgi:hypothetical protein